MSDEIHEDSPNHRFLTFDELAREYASQNLGTTSEDGLGLARISPELYYATSQSPWNQLDGLAPLFRVSPYRVKLDNDGNAEIVINPTEAFSHASYLQSANLVESLTWSAMNQRIIISRAVFGHLLSQLPPQGFLLPQLRSLTWLDCSMEYSDYLIPLIGPRLQDLRIYPHVLENRSLVVAMQQQCVALKELCLTDGLNPPDISHTFSELIPRLSNLGTFSSRLYFTEDAIAALAKLPRLTSCRVGLRSDVVVNSSLENLIHSGFPVLKFLALRVEVLSISSLAVIRAMHSKDLGSICLNADMESTTDVLYRHLDAIARSPFKKSLRTLQYRCSPLGRVDDPAYNITLAVLEPLLQITTLQGLVIDCVSRTSLDRDAFSALVEALPGLKDFQILSISQAAPEPLGLDILHLFADRCRALRTIGLTVDARLMPPLPDTWTSQSGVRHIILSNSPIDAPHPVIEYFWMLFPALGYVSHSLGNPNDPEQKLRDVIWAEVACAFILQPSEEAGGATEDQSE